MTIGLVLGGTFADNLHLTQSIYGWRFIDPQPAGRHVLRHRRRAARAAITWRGRRRGEAVITPAARRARPAAAAPGAGAGHRGRHRRRLDRLPGHRPRLSRRRGPHAGHRLRPRRRPVAGPPGHLGGQRCATGPPPARRGLPPAASPWTPRSRPDRALSHRTSRQHQSHRRPRGALRNRSSNRRSPSGPAPWPSAPWPWTAPRSPARTASKPSHWPPPTAGAASAASSPRSAWIWAAVGASYLFGFEIGVPLVAAAYCLTSVEWTRRWQRLAYAASVTGSRWASRTASCPCSASPSPGCWLVSARPAVLADAEQAHRHDNERQNMSVTPDTADRRCHGAWSPPPPRRPHRPAAACFRVRHGRSRWRQLRRAAGSGDFKGKTITLIAPDGPGGSYDSYARLFAPYLGQELGATVNVENVPAAAPCRAATRWPPPSPTG